MFEILAERELQSAICKKDGLQSAFQNKTVGNFPIRFFVNEYGIDFLEA
jgi:hypothetical protein